MDSVEDSFNSDVASKLPSTALVTLVSSDGREFMISFPAIEPCRLIKDALAEDIYDSYTSSDSHLKEMNVKIPILNVDSECLTHIVIFLNHYSKDPIQISKPLRGETAQDVVQNEWYMSFLNQLTQEDIFKLANAANYMDIPDLFDLCMVHISASIMGRSSEEIRLLLGLPSLSKEEERRAREEHPWLFEE